MLLILSYFFSLVFMQKSWNREFVVHNEGRFLSRPCSYFPPELSFISMDSVISSASKYITPVVLFTRNSNGANIFPASLYFTFDQIELLTK